MKEKSPTQNIKTKLTIFLLLYVFSLVAFPKTTWSVSKDLGSLLLNTFTQNKSNISIPTSNNNPFNFQKLDTSLNTEIVNILQLSYYPVLSDNSTIDPNITGINNMSLSILKGKVNIDTKAAIYTLEEGSAYRRYANTKYANLNSGTFLNYKLVFHGEINEPMPVSTNLIPNKTDIYYPDYVSMLNRINICDYVDNKNVKEIWVNGYHHGNIEPIENILVFGKYIMDNLVGSPYDGGGFASKYPPMPQCNKTYSLFNYNYAGGPDNMVHDHLHLYEKILRNALDPFSPFDALKYKDFYGNPQNPGDRNFVCGNTHYPPNTYFQKDGELGGYVVTSADFVDTICPTMTWKNTGKPVSINCTDWSCNQLGWYIYWMNSLPGENNNWGYGSYKVKNFWTYIADFDKAFWDGKNCGLNLVYDTNKSVEPWCKILQ